MKEQINLTSEEGSRGGGVPRKKQDLSPVRRGGLPALGSGKNRELVSVAF